MTAREIFEEATARAARWPAMVKCYRCGVPLAQVAAEFGFDEAYTSHAISRCWHDLVAPLMRAPASANRVYRPARGRRAA